MNLVKTKIYFMRWKLTLFLKIYNIFNLNKYLLTFGYKKQILTLIRHKYIFYN